MPILINIAAYQAAWFACVLGAANQLPWLGTATALVIVLVHVLRAQNADVELKLVGIAALVGVALDSGLSSARLIEFNTGVLIDGMTPHWMLALWIAFATTLLHSLNWLMKRPIWAAVFGALGGPMAYYAGVKLGAMSITAGTASFLAIGAAWALAMWLLAKAVAYVTASTPTAEITA
jgi:hypothetical protein